MSQADDVLKQLKKHAREAAEAVDLDKRKADAKKFGKQVRERLETDEKARAAAVGGGVLLAALLATKGGRGLVGKAAKVGTIGALGALAYKAWTDRQGANPPRSETSAPGYVSDKDASSKFSKAVITAMSHAAYADGTIDEKEMESIDAAVKRSGLRGSEAASLAGRMSEGDALDLIADAATSPNHAAQLYAAAVVATGDPSDKEISFLRKLSKRLGVDAAHAAAIRTATG